MDILPDAEPVTHLQEIVRRAARDPVSQGFIPGGKTLKECTALRKIKGQQPDLRRTESASFWMCPCTCRSAAAAWKRGLSRPGPHTDIRR